MILKINDHKIDENNGNKAKNLQILCNNNFNVPNGIIINNDILQNLDNHISDIISVIDENKLYAVRSSGIKEDLNNLSFAGLYDTYLNIKGKENIIEYIKKCYDSRLCEKNIEYCKNNNIDIKELKMSVIVQEMVDADFSGIAFTINPVTGNDKEFVIEVVKGLGEKNVSGKAKPEKYIYNWYEEALKKESDLLFKKNIFRQLTEQLLQIQMLFGYPVDVEFAIKDNKIYFLQVRPITKIMFSEMDTQWTTANFRDGGVSSRVCLPLMASIYSTAFYETERKAFIDTRLFKPDEIKHKFIQYIFGKLYWEFGFFKKGLAKTPGYIERDYDMEYGVPITYEGTGETTKITFNYLKNLPLIGIGLNNVINKQMNNIEEFNTEQLRKYKIFNDKKLEEKHIEQMEQTWRDYLLNEFFNNEGKYLLQVYINNIKQTSFKKEFLKILNYGEYLRLLSGIQNLSHIRPLKKESEIINKISKNKKILNYWKKTDEAQILKDYLTDKKQVYFRDINEYIEEYGFHSNSDLDLTVDPYYIDVKSIIIRFKNNITTDNLNALLKSQFEKNELHNTVIKKMGERLSKSKFKKAKKQIEEMRYFMWWREELKDLSNRYYSLVKKYTKALAQKYYSAGILEEPNDIHYLKYTDILDFMDKKLTKDDLYIIINKNKNYCKSFVNFKNPNDIGKRYKGLQIVSKKDSLKGIGCSAGVKTGKVRIVKSLADINKIQKGEILVTKFIDTGWISRFAILNGVISEYGGTLCHSSIVAREYEIPAIVGVEDVEKVLKNGEMIEMDGCTGEIRKL